MAYVPVSGVVPQFSRNAGGASADGYYLKGYSAGTTTPLSMGTDSTPTSTLAKCALNTRGEPISNDADPTTVFIPHFNASYKLALYTNATDADNNTTANAVWVVDNITGQFDASQLIFRSGATVSEFLSNLHVADYAAIRALTVTELNDGDDVSVSDAGISGDGVIVNSVAHGLSDNGDDTIVISSDWYWRRTYDGAPNPNWSSETFSTDIQSGLSNCVDNHGVAEFKAGTFTSATEEDFQPQRVHLKGQGHATVIDINQSSNHTAFRFAAVGTTDRDLTKLEAMKFTSSGSSAGIATAIEFNANQPMYISDVSFKDLGTTAVKGFRTYYGGFDNVTFFGSGLDLSNVNNIKISAFDFHEASSNDTIGAGEYFITLRDCDSIVFDTGTFECFTAQALVAYESRVITLYNTWIEQCKDNHVIKLVACQSFNMHSPFIVLPSGSAPSSALFVVDPTRTHTGANNSATLIDSTRYWFADGQIGQTVYNVTDGSSGTVTDNDETTLTVTLSGGTDNDFDTGDRYTIGRPKDLVTNINIFGGDMTLMAPQSTAFLFCRVDNGTTGKIHAMITLSGVNFHEGNFLLPAQALAKWENCTLSSVTAPVETVRFLESLPTAKLVDPINTHSGANNAATLTDREQNWETNELNGLVIYNDTDGSSGTITANTATTVTATLAGGTDNDWDAGDKYTIGGNGTATPHIQNTWVEGSEMQDPHMHGGAIVSSVAGPSVTITTDRTTTHSNGISTRIFIPAASSTEATLRHTCTGLTTATSGEGETYLYFIRMKASAVMPLKLRARGSVNIIDQVSTIETKDDVWIDYVMKTAETTTEAQGTSGTQNFDILVTNDTGSDQEVWIDRIDYKKVKGDVYLP